MNDKRYKKASLEEIYYTLESNHYMLVFIIFGCTGVLLLESSQILAMISVSTGLLSYVIGWYYLRKLMGYLKDEA